MAEDKTMEGIHNDLIKKYHVLCKGLGLTQEERLVMLSAYGVESSKDMDTHDLLDLIAKLNKDLNKQHKADESDRLRKQVMAAIGNWLRSQGKYSNASIIKGIACRASGKEDFNKIPRERLRNLVHLFNNKVKDAETVEGITSGKIVPLIPKEREEDE